MLKSPGRAPLSIRCWTSGSSLTETQSGHACGIRGNGPSVASDKLCKVFQKGLASVLHPGGLECGEVNTESRLIGFHWASLTSSVTGTCGIGLSWDFCQDVGVDDPVIEEDSRRVKLVGRVVSFRLIVSWVLPSCCRLSCTSHFG